MQLIDCELHWRFEHLRAHVEDKTRLNNTSRHGCDLFGHEFKILVVLFRCSVAVCTEKPGAMRVLGAVSEKHCRRVMLFLPQRGFYTRRRDVAWRVHILFKWSLWHRFSFCPLTELAQRTHSMQQQRAAGQTLNTHQHKQDTPLTSGRYLLHHVL